MKQETFWINIYEFPKSQDGFTKGLPYIITAYTTQESADSGTKIYDSMGFAGDRKGNKAHRVTINLEDNDS